MREVRVPEEAGVVVLGERGHPTFAERSLEFVFLQPGDLMDFVEKQHRGESHTAGRRVQNRLELRLVLRFRGLVEERRLEAVAGKLHEVVVGQLQRACTASKLSPT